MYIYYTVYLINANIKFQKSNKLRYKMNYDFIMKRRENHNNQIKLLRNKFLILF